MCTKSLQPCPSLCSAMEPARLLCPWDSAGKSTGVGCNVLLQGYLPNIEIEPTSLYFSCIGRWILYHQHHLGSPVKLRFLPQSSSESREDTMYPNTWSDWIRAVSWEETVAAQRRKSMPRGDHRKSCRNEAEFHLSPGVLSRVEMVVMVGGKQIVDTGLGHWFF